MKKTKIEQLITKAQGGDETSFQELYQLYYQKAFYLALKITNNEADAKDVTQETFIQIHRSLASLRDITMFQSWMNRIIVSKCNRMFVKYKPTYLDPDIIKQSNKAIENRIEMNPHTLMKKKLDQQILLQLLKQMKPKNREVLVSMYLCEMKQQEIADALQVNLNTIKSRSMYAKAELKDLVEAFEKQHDYRFKFRMETIGTALTLAFASEYGTMVTSVSMLASITGYLTKAGSFLSTHATQAVVCVLLTGSVASATYYAAGQYLQHVQESGAQINHPMANEHKYEQEAFTPILYQGKTYHNSKDAYYALVNWANTASLLEQKPNEEIEQAKSIYQSLKQNDNQYYHMLKNLEVSNFFE